MHRIEELNHVEALFLMKDYGDIESALRSAVEASDCRRWL